MSLSIGTLLASAGFAALIAAEQVSLLVLGVATMLAASLAVVAVGLASQRSAGLALAEILGAWPFFLLYIGLLWMRTQWPPGGYAAIAVAAAAFVAAALPVRRHHAVVEATLPERPAGTVSPVPESEVA